MAYVEGRRRFGTVGGAVVEVLMGAEGEMRLRDIHEAAEAKLGGSVSLHSVHDYLRTRSKGAKPLFERTRYGHYRLLR